MELLYVWIEDYNNIHHQGFNFSPKHKFEFKPKIDKNTNTVIGGELIEYPERDFPKDFFGKNISNITAIVGKNGSGKSSLLFYLFYLNKLEKNSSKYLFIFKGKDRDQKPAYTNIEIKEKKLAYTNIEIKNLSEYSIQKKEDQPDVAVIYYNLNLTRSYKKLHPIIEGKSDSFIKESTFIQTPDYKLFNLVKEATTHSKNGIELVDGFLNNDTWEQLNTLIGNKVNNEHESVNVDIPIPNIVELDFSEYSDLLNTTKDNLERLGFETKTSGNILECTIGNSYEYNNNRLKEFYAEIMKSDGGDPNDFTSCVKFKWGGLSAGEESFLSLLITLRAINPCLENSTKEIIVLLDEPENNAHPDWQKKVIQYIKRYAISGCSIQFIVTTHSPILLSDLPRENIVFLDKDADGNSVVKEPKEMERTFGANIHNLYRSSFFMQDGLMGKFAKEKIDDVIKDLRENGEIIEGRKKEIHYIIDMVGEPIIRNQLRKMYNEKFHKYDSLDERITKLENELAELKNRRNDTN